MAPAAFALSAPLATRSPFTTPALANSTSPAPQAPTPVHRRVTPAASAAAPTFSSIDRVLTSDPVSLPGDADMVIATCYTQVFGNAHIMDSEREELAIAESRLKQDDDVRAFVRTLALSDGYRDRFFDSVSMYRATELAFKHLLGRAPASRQEYAGAMAAYHAGGYEAFVSWFVDSSEYDENFGPLIVPYGIYMGRYPTSQQFNRSVAMRLTPSSSDKGRSSMLQYCVLSGDSPNWLSISKGLPAGTDKGTGIGIGGHWVSTMRNKGAPVKVATKIPGGVVFN